MKKTLWEVLRTISLEISLVTWLPKHVPAAFAAVSTALVFAITLFIEHLDAKRKELGRKVRNTTKCGPKPVSKEPPRNSFCFTFAQNGFKIRITRRGAKTEPLASKQKRRKKHPPAGPSSKLPDAA